MAGRGKTEKKREPKEKSKSGNPFIKFGSNERKKTKNFKTAHKWITYEGYIPELRMFLNDGYYFKVYRLEEPMQKQPLQKREKTDFLKQIGNYPGLKIQLVASKNKIYAVFGLKAELPEDVEEQFNQLEQSAEQFSFNAISCDEWFSVMAERLRFAPFEGIPEGKKGGKRTAIRLIQPYNVQIRQKEMEISGRTVKTLILTGYPSMLFPAFGTELLEISDKLTLSVFAEVFDAKMCLDGVNLSTDIRAARKEAMKDFLKQAIKEGTRIYNTCVLVAMEGLPGEVDELSQKLKLFCRKYLILASELDHQQADAYRSTLPLLKNHIRYYRVLTEENLNALLPWSALSVCKKNICYGEDCVTGEVKYDRRIYRENGFILSSNYDWAFMQAGKETEVFSKERDNEENIYFLAKEGRDFAAIGIEKGKEPKSELIRISYAKAPGWLIRAAIIRWAVYGLSTNGGIMKRHMDMVMKAAEILPDGNKEKQKSVLDGNEDTESEKLNHDEQFDENEDNFRINEYITQFLSRMEENERRALSVRPFIYEYDIEKRYAANGVLYQVKGSGLGVELAYALLFNQLHGMVYSLNSELLAWNPAEMFRLHGDSLYTFLTQDNRVLYESRSFKKLLNNAPFLLIGEHRIFEKLKLSALVGLNKSQKEWISEPAKGFLLMTKLVTYQLRQGVVSETLSADGLRRNEWLEDELPESELLGDGLQENERLEGEGRGIR